MICVSPERVGEQQPVKAMGGFCSEFQQLLARVPAAHYGGVHVREVARQGAAEQRTGFVVDSLVGMQARLNGRLNGDRGHASSGNSPRCCRPVFRSTSPLGRSPIPFGIPPPVASASDSLTIRRAHMTKDKLVLHLTGR